MFTVENGQFNEFIVLVNVNSKVKYSTCNTTFSKLTKIPMESAANSLNSY